MFTLGFIDKMPKVAVVQAEGASPFHKMLVQKKQELTPERFPYTRASALNIGNPPSWKKALKTVTQTKGVSISVTDEEILDSKAVIDKSGIGCESASAATIAGLRNLISQNVIDKDESVLCILTGNILKDTDALNYYHSGESATSTFKNTLQDVVLSYNNFKEFGL